MVTHICYPIIPALRKLRQEDPKFKVSLGYRRAPISGEKKKKRRQLASCLEGGQRKKDEQRAFMKNLLLTLTVTDCVHPRDMEAR
jgi:hypothetical protein